MYHEGQSIAFRKSIVDDLQQSGSTISSTALISEKDVVFCNPVHISPRCQVQANVTLGKFTFLNWDNIIYPHVSMGAFCSVGRGCQIGLAKHTFHMLSSHQFTSGKTEFERFPGYNDFPREPFRRHPPTQIGADVWIGAGALILPGLQIGHGAVIGCGAVVTKDVPPYAIVAGVPAKIRRYRFDERTVQRLLATQWWIHPMAYIGELPFSDIEKCLATLETAATLS